MLESLIGGALGGVLRFAPEVLKFFDRKADRHHEAVMLDKQLAADRQRAELNIRAIEAQDAAAMNAKDFDALIAAVEAQAQPTGVGWVDALTASVRPVLTYYWAVGLYTAALVARFILLVDSGVSPLVAVDRLWGPQEIAIASSMIAYWFVDRSLRKGGGVGPAH